MVDFDREEIIIRYAVGGTAEQSGSRGISIRVQGRAAICREVRGAVWVGAAVRPKRPGIEDQTNVPVDVNPFGLINDEQPV